MALVMIAPSLLVSSPWFVIFAFGAFLFALSVVAKAYGRQHVGGLLTAISLATVGIVISDDICKVFPWLLECWCPFCL